jgi:hypothetical protein
LERQINANSRLSSRGAERRRICGCFSDASPLQTSGLPVAQPRPIIIANRGGINFLRFTWTWPDYILLAIFASVVCWNEWRSRARVTNIRALAESRGFHFLGKSLPNSVPAKRLPNAPTSVWNVIDGDVRGVRVIAFDCRFGHGRGSWRRTVIAFSGGQDRPQATMFNTDVVKEHIADWLFLYHPKGTRFFPDDLMPISEIQAYIESIPG